MAIGKNVIEDARRRSGGYCECRRRSHGHRYVRCNNEKGAMRQIEY